MLLVIPVVLALSCTPTPSGQGEEPSGEIKQAGAKQEQVAYNQEDLIAKVFQKGGAHHLTDSCAFLFECDCCSGLFYFPTDSTFLQLETCMSDYTLMRGHFAVVDTSLVLTYSPQVVLRNYNYENEVDPSAVDYFYKDTLIDLPPLTYYTRICGGKRMLKDRDSEETAIEAAAVDPEQLEFLKNRQMESKK